jgi:hypothetical protein
LLFCQPEEQDLPRRPPRFQYVKRLQTESWICVICTTSGKRRIPLGLIRLFQTHNAVYLLDAARIQTSDGQWPPDDIIAQQERMKENAHKRYLAACAALAKVRRLLALVIN